jgi:hypothetical protein
MKLNQKEKKSAPNLPIICTTRRKNESHGKEILLQPLCGVPSNGKKIC